MNVFQIVGMDRMDQRSVVLFLRLKGLSKRAIHDELVAVLQENAVSYSSVTRVTRFCGEVILGLNSEAALSSPKDDGLNEVNEANEVNETILLALSDEPFSSVPSVRQMARRICIPKVVQIVYRRIVDSLHFTVRHQISDIKHQTYALGSSQALRPSESKSSQIGSSRVELSIQLRDLLLSIRHQ
jgi:hypothetical protein